MLSAATEEENDDYIVVENQGPTQEEKNLGQQPGSASSTNYILYQMNECAGGVVDGLTGLPKMCMNPIRTINGVGQTIAHPIATVEAVLHAIEKKPVRTLTKILTGRLLLDFGLGVMGDIAATDTISTATDITQAANTLSATDLIKVTDTLSTANDITQATNTLSTVTDISEAVDALSPASDITDATSSIISTHLDISATTSETANTISNIPNQAIDSSALPQEINKINETHVVNHGIQTSTEWHKEMTNAASNEQLTATQTPSEPEILSTTSTNAASVPSEITDDSPLDNGLTLGKEAILTGAAGAIAIYGKNNACCTLFSRIPRKLVIGAGAVTVAAVTYKGCAIL